ncbi:MAG: CsbD family protein [Chlamydiota bacterium]|nr:CsbD family protein [Chlamydiota bacterium]
MDTNTLKGSWDIVKGKIKEKWGELTDDDLQQIDGKKDQLIGKLEQKYGHTKEEAQKMVDKFENYLN